MNPSFVRFQPVQTGVLTRTGGRDAGTVTPIKCSFLESDNSYYSTDCFNISQIQASFQGSSVLQIQYPDSSTCVANGAWMQAYVDVPFCKTKGNPGGVGSSFSMCSVSGATTTSRTWYCADTACGECDPPGAPTTINTVCSQGLKKLCLDGLSVSVAPYAEKAPSSASAINISSFLTLATSFVLLVSML